MKILLADDHDLVADAIVALLKSNDEELEIDAVRDLPMVRAVFHFCIKLIKRFTAKQQLSV